MKTTIKSIILVTLIACSLALSVKRVEKNEKKAATAKKTVAKTTKAQTKDDGSGDWNGGYNCPGFLVVTGNAGFDENQRKGKGKFYGGKLETPSTAEEKLGWYFDMSAQLPSDPLTKIMVKASGNNYYIPFRWLSSDFGYTNPNGYKYLEGWVTNDAKESYHVRLLLPYSTLSWYISDDEGKKISTLLNTRRTEHQGIVGTKKSGATSAANSYLSNKPLYDGAVGDAAKLKAEQDKQKAQVVTLEAEVNTKRTTYNTNQAQITTLESQLQTLKSAQTELNTAISSISNQITTINANLAAISTTTPTEQAAKYKLALDTAEADLKKNLADLKTEATVRETDIVAAQTAILTSLSKDSYTSSLSKVYP
jgi:hypothetical protein